MLGEWVLANLYDQGKGIPADKRKVAALRELIAEQKNNAIWNNLDTKTPSGLTLRQALGVGLAINGAIMKELDDDGLRFDCTNGHRSACEALRAEH